MVIYQNTPDKVNSLASSIFKTFGTITLASTLIGLCSLNPLAGFVVGAALSISLSPIIVAYHIASKILS